MDTKNKICSILRFRTTSGTLCKMLQKETTTKGPAVIIQKGVV